MSVVAIDARIVPTLDMRIAVIAVAVRNLMTVMMTVAEISTPRTASPIGETDSITIGAMSSARVSMKAASVSTARTRTASCVMSVPREPSVTSAV